MTVADAVTRELAAISAIEPAQVRPEAMLIELGLDSVRGVELLVALEARFDLELRDDAIAAVMTVGDVIHLVEDQLAQARQDAPHEGCTGASLEHDPGGDAASGDHGPQRRWSGGTAVPPGRLPGSPPCPVPLPDPSSR